MQLKEVTAREGIEGKTKDLDGLKVFQENLYLNNVPE